MAQPALVELLLKLVDKLAEVLRAQRWLGLGGHINASAARATQLGLGATAGQVANVVT